ncbi:MAG TPA: hypothetical protein VN035_12575, partial [Microbacterium sp.]|nr:hypothetical protein [Microbacterium sp.]
LRHRIVARPRQSGEFAQLRLSDRGELVDARGVRRLSPGALGPLDPAIKVGDIEEEALLFGAGVHVPNLVAADDIVQPETPST